jgi:hypothetical protein
MQQWLIKNAFWMPLSITPILAATLFVPGCGRSQQLQSITVQPAMGVFGAAVPTAKIQLTATGSYIHPPENKDITNQVIWSSDVTSVAVVNNSGSVSPNVDCGVANITATVYANQQNQTGNVVTGTATITVDGTGPNCPNTLP